MGGDRIVQVGMALGRRSIGGGLELGEMGLVHALADRIADASCGEDP